MFYYYSLPEQLNPASGVIFNYDSDIHALMFLYMMN